MISLPPQLAAWREQLDLFDPEVAASLGGLIRRLDAAIGPLRVHQSAPGADVDGYGGLARRGPYDRLLLSEWLLADEFPDEFIRRAAMQEHAFLELARREPAGHSRSVVLFDAGPGQLGPPRIAQLALLIVLARRAIQAKAAFTWIAAQDLALDPSQSPFQSEASETSIRTFLKASSIRDVDAETVKAADAYFAEQKTEDLWFIGEKVPAGWSGSFVEIADVLDPNLSALRVKVKPKRGISRDLELELPDPRACVRVLRDPFRKVGTPQPERVKHPGSRHLPVSTESDIIFASGGRHVFVQLQDAAVACFKFQANHPESTSPPKLVVPDRRRKLLAVGRHIRKTLHVSISDTHLFVSGIFNFQGQPISIELQPHEFSHLRSLGRVGHCFAVGRMHEWRIVFTCGGRAFSLVVSGSSPPRWGLWDIPVVDIVHDGQRVIILSDPERDTQERCFIFEPDGSLKSSLFANFPLTRGWPAFFGTRDRYQTHPDLGLFGLQTAPGVWRVLDEENQPFEPPPNARVCGVLPVNRKERSYGFLWIEDNTWLTIGPGPGAFNIAELDEEIVHARVSPYSDVVGYITASGEFVVYSVEFRRVVHRHRGRGTS